MRGRSRSFAETPTHVEGGSTLDKFARVVYNPARYNVSYRTEEDPMGVALAQAVLTSVSGLPEDNCINTFHVEYDGALGPTDAQTIATAVQNFYNVAQTDGNKVCHFISDAISRVADACRVKVYDLSDPEPRAPVLEDPWTLGAEALTNQLPHEVAIALSYRGAVESGANMARRRGRIYIGPLTTAAAQSTIAQCRPATIVATTLLDAADDLQSELVADTKAWVVYSRIDDEPHIIEHCWVDDAFDIQRRRGVAPTSRTTRTVFP